MSGISFCSLIFLFLKSLYLVVIQIDMAFKLFAILQKYDFSSKSQPLSLLSLSASRCLRYCKSTIFQANHNDSETWGFEEELFAILQKYDFSSKSQLSGLKSRWPASCLRYCKSTIFQANHNETNTWGFRRHVVCDTAKVRFFKQITTVEVERPVQRVLFAILQKYDFSSKSQLTLTLIHLLGVVCDTAKVRFFKQITTALIMICLVLRCLRYCKSTIFQANHNRKRVNMSTSLVVCDTAKVRFFKQITTVILRIILVVLLFAILQKYDFSSKSQLARYGRAYIRVVCDTAKVRFFKQITTQKNGKRNTAPLFAILQKYDFSSKSQPYSWPYNRRWRCLRYCKSTIFQANHNTSLCSKRTRPVVCDTAKVRFFKQITTDILVACIGLGCLRYCKSTIFQANHNSTRSETTSPSVVCDTAKVRFFKQITTPGRTAFLFNQLFAILQKYDFSSKSQRQLSDDDSNYCCLRYCKSTIFQANHNVRK